MVLAGVIRLLTDAPRAAVFNSGPARSMGAAAARYGERANGGALLPLPVSQPSAGHDGNGGDLRHVDGEFSLFSPQSGGIGDGIGAVGPHADVEELQVVLQKLVVLQADVDVAGPIVQVFDVDRIVDHAVLMRGVHIANRRLPRYFSPSRRKDAPRPRRPRRTGRGARGGWLRRVPGNRAWRLP